MRSFIRLALVAGAVGGGRGVVLQAPTPTITPAPQVEAFVRRQGPDAVSLAQILLTAIPESLRQIAATNVPAVSSILWEEFLDDKKPEWFLELPYEIQSYLISKFGPSTAWLPEPTEPAGSSEAGVTASASATDMPIETAQSRLGESSRSGDATTLATSVKTESTRSLSSPASTSPTSSSEPNSPPASSSNLSKNQKIGIGVGVPLAILGAAALLFGFCFLLRWHRQKKEGSVPPSSPGFIPRFAFQEKSTENLVHRTPLNRDLDHSAQDLGHMNWDDDVIEAMNTDQTPSPPPPLITMGMSQNRPTMAPALYHTHSSNRARGRRTSYTSLHSVAEVSEPEDPESPVLGRQSSPRSLIPPPIPAAAQVKRKPVATSTRGYSPAAQAAAQTLLRQTMPNHSNSSSSGFGSSSSGLFTNASSSSGLGDHTEVTSPVSPIEENNRPKNPFGYDYSYVEDYGPEYHHGYVDIENGLYGGHTSLSRYPEPQKQSGTEWPLRNIVGSRRHQRNKSPLWDQIYEE